MQRLLQGQGIPHIRAAAAGNEAQGKALAPFGLKPATHLAHLPAAAYAALERALADPAACRRLAAAALEVEPKQ